MANDKLLCAIAIAIISKRIERKKRKRSKRSKEWLVKRQKLSHINLLDELRLEPEGWFNYLRMDETTYLELLQLITPRIKKEDPVMGKSITPDERLNATLRFLATGRCYEDLTFSCAITPEALGEIIPDTCKAIYVALKKKYIPFPKSENEWKKIGNEFEKKWQFPNCVGSMAGKHIRIVPPKDSGYYYWNHKGYNSLVFIGMANANYELIYCDVGTNGRFSDGGVIKNTKFYDKLVNGQLNLPSPSVPNNGTNQLPWVFIGDKAFSLRKDFLKPFSLRELSTEKKIFNYRLSRAQRIIENVFGIMAARFKILRTDINLSPNHIDLVVLTCAVLHNYLRRKCASSYTPVDSLDQEDWMQSVVHNGLRVDSNIISGLEHGHNRNYAQEANEVRELYVRYFNGEGQVTWQNNMIH